MSLTSKAIAGNEIEQILAKDSKVVGKLTNLLSANNISRLAKARLYQAVLWPTVLYACETK